MFRLLLALSLATCVFAQSDVCAGRALSPAGSPVSGLTVQLATSSVITDTSGNFKLTGLKSGPAVLTASGLGYIPLELRVEVPCTSLTLKLETIQTTIEVRAPSTDFLATSSVSIAKSPTALIDLPQAAQVIPKALLEDRNIQDIKDLYRNISGVTDSTYSAMTMRGFTQREVLFNGVRGNPYGSLDNDINDAGFSTSQGRLTNIEFVEVLKGPAAVLFGGGEAGGVINFVTRKPRNTPAAEASFRTGSYAQRGGHGEVTGPLPRSRNLFYRAAIYGEERRIFRYNSGSENIHLATGLSWRAAESTTLGFEYEYIDQNLLAHRLRGIPTNASGAWLTNRDWTASEPSDRSQLQARIFQTRLDHAFTPLFRTDVTFRFLNYDRPEAYHEPRGILADGTMRREYRDQFRGNSDVSLTANFYRRIARNNLTFGAEFVRQDWLGRYGAAATTPLSLTAPLYGRSTIPTIGSFTRQTVLSNRQGYFIQDQIEITPRLQVLLGGRLERFTDDGRAGDLPLRSELTALTGRAAAVYRLIQNLSLFASYSNSFNRAPSLAQTPLANGPHSPELGRQFETGLKHELAQGRVLLNASWFHITKRNVLRPDPNFGPQGSNFAAVFAIGRVRNQGLELDITGKLTNTLSLIANYAFLDSEILADRFTPSAVGRPLPNAARHSGGLFLRYDFTRTRTSLHLGSELRGRRYEPYAGILAGGYATLDVGLFQKIGKRLEFRAQLDNATDRFYATASLFVARAGNIPGAPRTATFALHFR